MTEHEQLQQSIRASLAEDEAHRLKTNIHWTIEELQKLLSDEDQPRPVPKLGPFEIDHKSTA